jgi:hypothetical protein
MAENTLTKPPLKPINDAIAQTNSRRNKSLIFSAARLSAMAEQAFARRAATRVAERGS